MRYIDIGKEHARAYALIFPRAGPAGPNHGGRARAQSARGVFLHFGRLNSYVTDLPLRARTYHKTIRGPAGKETVGIERVIQVEILLLAHHQREKGESVEL